MSQSQSIKSNNFKNTLFILYFQFYITYHYNRQIMQNTTQVLKNDIWSKLKVFFDLHKDQSNELSIDNLDLFVVEVLKEQTQNERDYVLKNHFRLDVDQNGSVSFIQLGNFLFKSHCCQMSLQRRHRAGNMVHGAARKLTSGEFIELVNHAYEFLHVTFSKDVGEFIFNSVDADKDGLITYVQYFQAIQRFVCQNPKEDERDKKVPDQQGVLRHSKLRKHIWQNLRRLYDAHVQGRTLLADDAELKALLFAIVGQLSDFEVTFIASGLNKLDFKTISFEAFASQFIYLIGELGLSKFAINRQSSKRNLSKEEFARLLKNSYSFLNLNNFKDSILHKIFAKIDKNHDGLVSYDDYLDWVKRFLAVKKYTGDEFYVSEDDEDKDPSSPYDKIPDPIRRSSVNRFTFNDYAFAIAVRARVWDLLIPYDQDNNQQFDEKQIENALSGIMNENQHELKYVTRNVFRYDRNNDNQVTYFQLTNFCVESHFGEIIIQRLHKKKFYSEGAKRIMNRQEFGKTINLVLNHIQMQATQQLLDSLFHIIDLDHDGWISYEVYFSFLTYYFGGASVAALETINKIPPKQNDKPVAMNEDQSLLHKLKDLNPFERFSRIICDQLKDIFFRFDQNNNKIFEYSEIKEILVKVFEFDSFELSYILMKYFTFDAENAGLTCEELIALILTIYYSEIIFKNKYKSNNSKHWTDKKISLEIFITIFSQDTFFIKFKPLREDLVYIFKKLDTGQDGFISYRQYSNFVKTYLGNGIDLNSSKYATDLSGVTEDEFKFVLQIWDELKAYFDRYDKGSKGYLSDEELRDFVIEVLQETSETELNYIFWNLFRVDTNQNQEIDFLEFAPFILNHAGEIALQRFHRQQFPGKKSLEGPEFYQVLSNAYSFLSSIPKEKKIIGSIFDRIKSANGDVVIYASFLNWIHRALAAKYKK